MDDIRLVKAHIEQLLQPLKPGGGSIGLVTSDSLYTQATEQTGPYLFVPVFGSGQSDTPELSCIVLTGDCLTENLPQAAALCAKQKIPLIIVSRNLAHQSISFPLLAGKTGEFHENTGRIPAGARTLDWLNRELAASGFSPLAQNDIRRPGTSFSGDRSDCLLLQSGAVSNTYLKWIKSHLDPLAEAYTFVRAYVCDPSAAAEMPTADNAGGSRPFLSVVTRTQGKRPHELNEVLLCLSAQTDIDFEMLIVGHKVPLDCRDGLQALVDKQPESFRKRIRCLFLETGGRSAPLNFGFEHANGEYIAILDDDDIVMDHWAETFHTQAKKTPGAVLRAWAVRQEWERGPLPGGLRAVKKPDGYYCRPFDPIAQMYENFCPPVSLAFPAAAFHQSNLRFDDGLNTTEDWDFLMKMAVLAGVADIPEVTCIYRIWVNGETSHTLHSEDEWSDNRRLIRDRFDATPTLLPPGNAIAAGDYWRDATKFRAIQTIGGGVVHTRTAILYLGTNGVFRDDATLRQDYTSDVLAEEPDPECPGRFNVSFTFPVPEEMQAGLTHLRFDPVDHGEIAIESIVVTLRSPQGERRQIAASSNNGVSLEPYVFFLLDDPQFCYIMPKDFAVSTVEVGYILHEPIPRNMRQILWQHLAPRQTPRFLARVCGRLKRLLR